MQKRLPTDIKYLTSIKLPLAGSKIPASVFLCSVPVDGEHSVTLQVKDTCDINSDVNQLATLKNNSFEIDFQDSDLFGDTLSSLQASSLKSLNFNSNGDLTAISEKPSPLSLQEASKDCPTSHPKYIAQKETKATKQIIQALSTVSNSSANKQNSYIKNCLIRSSSCGNNNPKVTSLAQIMSNSSTSSNAIILNTNSNCSSVSSLSSSSASNDSSSTRKENSESEIVTNSTNNLLPVANSLTTSNKKGRAKLLSPLRHGPQQCQICNKVFGNASALAKHKLTHSDERKYICGMCSKAFKRQDHLNGHMMTHRNKKPYECKIEGCGKSYCDARSLRRHTENHHGPGSTRANNTYRTYLKTIVDASALKAATEGDLNDMQLPIKIGVTVLSPTNSSSSNCGTSSMSFSDSSSKHGLPDLGSEDDTQSSQQLESFQMIGDSQTNNQLPVENKSNVEQNFKMNDQSQQQQILQVDKRSELINKMANNNAVQISFSTNTVSEVEPTNGINVSKENLSNKQFSINPRLLNLVKINDQKPVECNLCHRKFKNVPALNGHMRLHGGYFKKDTDSKKSDKKDGNTQPLQTASLGVRALIEEKIINKRCKEQTKGAFIIPAAPSLRLSSPSGNHFSSVLPPAVTILESKKKNESKHQFFLSPDFDILNTKMLNENSSNMNGRESTLVELLKRGNGTLMQKSCFNEENNNMNLTISGPDMPDFHCSSLSSLQLNALTSPRNQSTAIISLSDGSAFPLSLGQNCNNLSGEFYTVSYGNDSSQAFEDSEVYKITNSELLLSDVDNLQLLNDPSSTVPIKIEHSDTFIQTGPEGNEILDGNQDQKQNSLPLEVFNSFDSQEMMMQNSDDLDRIDLMEAKKLLQASDVNNEKDSSLISPIPTILDYPTPPSSHENLTHSSPFDCNTQTNDSNSSFFKFGSEFLLDTNSEMFKISSDPDLTDKEKILKLKNELEENSFEVAIKVEDLLNTPCSESECDLRDFSNSNLQFLDYGDQEFLATSQEIPSQFSESFFENSEQNENEQTTAKAAEKEIDISIDLDMDTQITTSNSNNNVVNSDYISEPDLQSQMMMNSDDPLLSSSPKEFGQQRQFLSNHQVIVDQSETVQQPLIHISQDSSQSDNSIPENIMLTTNGEVNLVNDLQLNLVDHDSSIMEESHQQNNLVLNQNNHFNFEDKIENSNNSSLSNGTENTLKPIQNNNDMDEGIFLAPPPCTRKDEKNLDSGSYTSSILKRRLRPYDHDEPTNHNASFKVFPSVRYNSKLKKPSRTHYTPPPILNPDRKGHGLYCNLRKRQSNSLLAFDSLLMEDDHPGIVEFSDESKVNLGSAYQAQIPPCRDRKEKKNDRVLGEELMWDPAILKDEIAVSRYVELSRSTAFPVGGHSEEAALRALTKCRGKTSSAVLSLLQTRSTTAQTQWLAHEIDLFLKGLEKYGKNFPRIAKDIKSKSASECIQMYYFWKKICLDYKGNYLKADIVLEPPPPAEVKPFACEVTDCFASFACKAALHSHSRIHTYGKTSNSYTLHNSSYSTSTFSASSPYNSTSSTFSISDTCTPTKNYNYNSNNNNNNNNSSDYRNCKTHNNSTSPTYSTTSSSTSTSTTDNATNHTSSCSATTSITTNSNKDDKYPCKVCGKIFSKVKSRSAHMKTHRVTQERSASMSSEST